MVGADWQGAASSEFARLWENWDKSARGQHDSLGGISRLLGDAGRAYQQTEDDLERRMRERQPR